MKGYCEACRQPCEVEVVDYGIGSYEYWGYNGVNSSLCAVSTCCEATVFEDEELTRPISVEDVQSYGHCDT